MQNKNVYNLSVVILSVISLLSSITLNYGYTYPQFVTALTFIFYFRCFVFKKAKNPIIFGAVILINLSSTLFFRLSIMGGITWQNLSIFILHTVLPLTVIYDYVAFFKKGNFKIYYPFIWAMAPMLFLASSYFLISKSKITYPYFFMNSSAYGLKPVLYLIFLILIVLLILGYVLVLVDKVLRKEV